MTSPLPDRQLLVAFHNGPLDDLSAFIVDAAGVTPSAGHWTDLSAYAPHSSYQIDAGVQHDLGQGEAGTFKVDLRNDEGQFNPWIPTNGLTPGLFSPWLASPRDGGTINLYGGLKLPVQVRDKVKGAQLLTPTQCDPGDVDGGWSGAPNTTRSALSGYLGLTSVAAGTIYSTTGPGRIPAAPGYTYTAAATFLAATVGRTVLILVQYWDAAGSLIRQYTTTGTDNTVTATTLTYSAVSPALTDRVTMVVQVNGTGAGGEAHLVTDMSLTGPDIIYAFTGHARVWRAMWPDPLSTWAELEADDAFVYFNDQQLANNRYSAAVTSAAAHYWRCNDAPNPTGATLVADYSGGQPIVVHNGTGGAIANTDGPGVTLADSSSGGSASLNFGSYSAGGGQAYATSVGVPTGSWTWMAWVQGMAQTDTTIIAQYYNTATPGFNTWGILGTASTGPGVAYTVTDNAGLFYTYPGTAIVADGLPHMLEVKYDGTSFRFYVDGVVDGLITAPFTGSTAGTLKLGGDDFPGGGGPPDSQYAGVTMSEIAIFNSLRSGPQSAALFAAAWVFLTQYTGQRIGAVLDLMGWPAGLRELDIGVQICQRNTQDMTSVTGLTHMQDAETTEEGALWVTGDGMVRFVSRQNLTIALPFSQVQCWFGDEVQDPAALGWDTGTWDGTFEWGTSDVPFDPGTAPVLDDTDIITGATVTRVGGLAQSIGGGTRVKSISTPLHQTEICSLAHAAWLIGKEGVPVARLEQIVIDLTEILGDPDAVARVLRARARFTRIAVERSEVGFTEVGLVEHCSETTTADSWIITLTLSTTGTYPLWNWGGAQ